MLPGDRLVCAFVKPQAAGEEFAEWPLHVTVVPWFRLPDDAETVAAGLRKALASLELFAAKAGEMLRFGPRKNRPARLVQSPAPFIKAEQKVRGYFHKKRAWLVDETTKRQHAFRPHVTVQKGGELGRDEIFRVDRLYLVEQKGNYKEVVAEIYLTSKRHSN
jgi:2'-5' RNA ligase